MTMKLLIEWADESVVLEPDKTYVLGRDQSSDIHVASDRISRSHLRFGFEKTHWVLQDLGSSNGTYVGNKKFERLEVVKPVSVDLGGIGNLTIKISPVGDSVSGKSKRPQVDRDATRITKISGSEYQDDNSGLARVRLQQRIRIGRDAENEWQIDDLNVSRTHAEIIQNNSGSFEIVDLKLLTIFVAPVEFIVNCGEILAIVVVVLVLVVVAGLDVVVVIVGISVCINAEPIPLKAIVNFVPIVHLSLVAL